MDWTIFSTAFFTALISEMGDKTQIAGMALSSRTMSTGSVLLGTLLGLSLAASLSVLLGRFIGSSLNPAMIRWASGALFICMGIWILSKSS
jgi:putative Ca2+/H+ antiporter (TMEM165/GDT1 family)